MRSPSRRPTIGVAVALVIASAVALSREPRAEGPDGAVASIRAVLDKQEADWNRGDLDAFLEGYWRSPGVVFLSGGDRRDGFDAMRDHYRKQYQAEGMAMGKLALSRVEIQPLGPDAAFARGAWKLALPGGKAPGGVFTLIFRKFPEGWKIVHDHTSVAGAPAAPAPD